MLFDSQIWHRWRINIVRRLHSKILAEESILTPKQTEELSETHDKRDRNTAEICSECAKAMMDGTLYLQPFGFEEILRIQKHGC
ncbi:MAG TPA: hypothetical protein VN420_04660 [Candidatus Fimivivens sp.]|nr:hypothetical protein [Candidatus Fimivivens sp.]